MVFRFLNSPRAGGRQQQSDILVEESATVESKLYEDEAQNEVEAILVSDGTSSEVATPRAIPTPVLSEVDEHFFQELAEDLEERPPLPPRPDSAAAIDSTGSEGQDSSEDLAAKRKWADFIWDYMPSTPKIPESLTRRANRNDKEKAQAADDLMAAAVAVKSQKLEDDASNLDADGADMPSEEGHETEEQDQDQVQQSRELDTMLKNISFSAVNEHIVSLSDDSQVLLNRFTQILRDLVAGVPTAYKDFETLFTEKHTQLDKMYRSMPKPVQTLIKTELLTWWKFTYPTALFAARKGMKTAASPAGGPSKVSSKGSSSSTGGTVTLASVSADGGLSGSSTATSSGAAQLPSSGTANKAGRSNIASFKRLIPGRGAIVAMLQSILTFLRSRFPLLLAGSNLLVGFAVLILLLVCWYCYSRGREARLSEEQDQKNVVPSATSEVLKKPEAESATAEASSDVPDRLPSGAGEEALASQDAGSLQTLQSLTTLEESSRLASIHDSAAKVKLPHAIPLPATSSSIKGE